jgi:hypothetical protein
MMVTAMLVTHQSRSRDIRFLSSEINWFVSFDIFHKKPFASLLDSPENCKPFDHRQINCFINSQ